MAVFVQGHMSLICVAVKKILFILLPQGLFDMIKLFFDLRRCRTMIIYAKSCKKFQLPHQQTSFHGIIYYENCHVFATNHN